MSNFLARVTSLLLISLTIVSIVLTSFLFIWVRLQQAQQYVTFPRAFENLQPIGKHHTFLGEDYPESLSLQLDQPVAMHVEESVHFSLDNSSRTAWLAALPFGNSMVRLGDMHRPFLVTTFHEQHCVQYLEGVLTGVEVNLHTHIHHCLNYLLQMTLCDADLTLEPGDFTKRNFSEDREGEIHICRDWEPLYNEATVNWIEWYKFMKTHDTARTDHNVIIT
ncbi:hypothetical protein BDP27DRAFT_1255055 [Rhodocollybia butyracea]|uniref:Oxidase ustYa n=1 Tax=Rhodocollybia butyracea TaxID=206335 RepID=A0A9P5Q7Q8_9AGAR|nr:hypothetical protein BDP27DRAFT_1255055 [Rhodocollybia butyracea]